MVDKNSVDDAKVDLKKMLSEWKTSDRKLPKFCSTQSFLLNKKGIKVSFVWMDRVREVYNIKIRMYFWNRSLSLARVHFVLAAYGRIQAIRYLNSHVCPYWLAFSLAQRATRASGKLEIHLTLICASLSFQGFPLTSMSYLIVVDRDDATCYSCGTCNSSICISAISFRQNWFHCSLTKFELFFEFLNIYFILRICTHFFACYRNSRFYNNYLNLTNMLIEH